MPSIESLLEELDERTIAQKYRHHDEMRMNYQLDSNTCAGFEDFEEIIGDYYNDHFTQCNTYGGEFPRSQAISRAKAILEQASREHGGNLNTFYTDASTGTNNGLRRILDIIADALKSEAIAEHVRDAFDRHISPVCWEDKVEIIRQLQDVYGAVLPSELRSEQPQRFAHNYNGLVRHFAGELQRIASSFRRL